MSKKIDKMISVDEEMFIQMRELAADEYLTLRGLIRKMLKLYMEKKGKK